MEFDLEAFRSHPHKLLHIHTQGVIDGTKLRTNLWIAEVAAIFHDVGKLNPFFQEKLGNMPPTAGAYSNHACLSAYAFLCFLAKNRDNPLGLTASQIFSIIALTARHHGNLTNFTESIIGINERDRMVEFLKTQPYLPASDFLRASQSLQSLTNHKPFDLFEKPTINLLKDFSKCSESVIATAPLDFVLETQFAFSCLIESDKRDAGDNKEFRRAFYTDSFAARVDTALTKTLASFTMDSELNKVRTQIREEAVTSLKSALDKDQRVFSLTSPTGSGKTMMLLALANEILQKNNNLGIIYGLPFLSITEQVERVCRDILNTDNPEEDVVLRIDSKAHNERMEKLQEELDNDPAKIDALLQESFAQDTFDAPFIITTFVQLFETFMSNRNATLLRLPNFSNTIFLVDEIQALPPRLYVFFTAFLDAFCRKFNSYAIISTATMPALEIASKATRDPQECPERLFTSYVKPQELVNASVYYGSPVFDRYKIQRMLDTEFSLEKLAEKVSEQKSSCLIILNTIDDTKNLFDILSTTEEDECIMLLSTLFTPHDRRRKIARAKQVLDKGERIVLITTQLIEAGVDIDFPVVFRDLCPLPNLIQAAGRCNRNGLLQDHDGNSKQGIVFVFELKNENKKSRAALIYQKSEPAWYLDFSRTNLPEIVRERDLLGIQQAFFELVNNNLSIGEHPKVGKDYDKGNLIRCINEAAFENMGRFRLIDEQDFGKQFRYYIPQGPADTDFEQLEILAQSLTEAKRKRGNYKDFKKLKVAVEAHLRSMAEHIVQLRIKEEDVAPAFWNEIFGIRKLGNECDYTFTRGIGIAPGSNFI